MGFQSKGELLPRMTQARGVPYRLYTGIFLPAGPRSTTKAISGHVKIKIEVKSFEKMVSRSKNFKELSHEKVMFEY